MSSLHLGHVEEPGPTADQTASRERQLGDALSPTSTISVTVNSREAVACTRVTLSFDTKHVRLIRDFFYCILQNQISNFPPLQKM